MIAARRRVGFQKRRLKDGTDRIIDGGHTGGPLAGKSFSLAV